MLSGWIRRNRIRDAVVCSVVPSQTRPWCVVLGDLLGQPPLVMGSDLDLGITIDYPRPRTIGADRLADVCAGRSLYGAPVLVLDIGTAATFNMVRSGGRFVGGAIAPGPALFMQYLAERTAQLPRVDFPHGKMPRVGRTTEGAMRLAAGVGYRGMVSSIVRHILGVSAARVPVVATGGYARAVAAGIAGIRFVDPLLTLRGMAHAHALNRVR